MLVYALTTVSDPTVTVPVYVHLLNSFWQSDALKYEIHTTLKAPEFLGGVPCNFYHFRCVEIDTNRVAIMKSYQSLKMWLDVLVWSLISYRLTVTSVVWVISHSIKRLVIELS